VTLGGYLGVIRERWKLVALALIIGVAGAVALTVTATPQYSSQVTLFISAQGDPTDASSAYQGSLLSAQKVKSYVELLSSERLSQDVITATDAPITPGKLSREISATSQPDTVLLTATVTDPSPARAQFLANSLGVQFGLLVADLERPANGKAPSVTARVVQRAQLSASPVSPKPVRNIGLGAALGLLVGLGAAFARNALDTSVKSVEQLERATGVPNLGTIAYDPKVRKRPLIVQEHPQAPRSEAFRQIRTSLQFIDVDRPNKMIVVASSLPEEGKTTTLCNLAIAMAQAGNKVALVEADLRRPRAANYLGLEGAVGLTSVLSGQASLEDALQTWGDDLFAVLASGPVPPNPSELLASDRMRKLLMELQETYDTILIDTPPLIPVTDAAAVAVHSDGALLITRHGATSRDQVQKAVGVLAGVNVRVLGTVFSMTPASGTSSYYYAYSSDSTESKKGLLRRRRASTSSSARKINFPGDSDLKPARTAGTRGGARTTNRSDAPPSTIEIDRGEFDDAKNAQWASSRGPSD
jgi:capsular exopolysaccharide synthesis family protein